MTWAGQAGHQWYRWSGWGPEITQVSVSPYYAACHLTLVQVQVLVTEIVIFYFHSNIIYDNNLTLCIARNWCFGKKYLRTACWVSSNRIWVMWPGWPTAGVRDSQLDTWHHPNSLLCNSWSQESWGTAGTIVSDFVHINFILTRSW